MKSAFLAPVSHSMEIPFHVEMNKCHQVISAMAGTFTRTWWLGFEPMHFMEYSRLRKQRPGHTTFVANCSIPTKLSSSYTVALQLRLPDDKLQCLKSELARCIRRDTLQEKSIPRNFIVWEGPSNFDISIGTPKRSHSETKTCLSNSAEVWLGETIMKSSK